MHIFQILYYNNIYYYNMKSPYKVVHKYKNSNRRIQYKIYIYIGPHVPSNVYEVLEFISNKDFITMLQMIKKADYKIIEEYYGEFWYEYFFTSYHIQSQIKQIQTTKSKATQLQDKFDNLWFNRHISDHKIKSVNYSFANEYYDDLLAKNKIKNINKKAEIDYRTYNITNNMEGGNDDIDVVEDVEEEIDLDDITKLYETNDIESKKDTDETIKLISDAINNKSWEKKANIIEKTYDDKYDLITYDSNINDIYDKNYITDQYIYHDNTIKSLKHKITTSIPLSSQFGKSIRLLPECQYLWSEYLFSNTKEYIMLGHKWITRNELLKIDIKPNDNLKIYEKLRNNLSYLKDNIGYKIKRDDDDDKTLNHYDKYITCNEIFMIDIYNDMGINYDTSIDEMRNLFYVYINFFIR
jgi:hypothetical protein